MRIIIMVTTYKVKFTKSGTDLFPNFAHNSSIIIRFITNICVGNYEVKKVDINSIQRVCYQRSIRQKLLVTNRYIIQSRIPATILVCHIQINNHNIHSSKVHYQDSDKHHQ